jgi:hypothetical protein
MAAPMFNSWREKIKGYILATFRQRAKLSRANILHVILAEVGSNWYCIFRNNIKQLLVHSPSELQ